MIELKDNQKRNSLQSRKVKENYRNLSKKPKRVKKLKGKVRLIVRKFKIRRKIKIRSNFMMIHNNYKNQ